MPEREAALKHFCNRPKDVRHWDAAYDAFLEFYHEGRTAPRLSRRHATRRRQNQHGTLVVPSALGRGCSTGPARANDHPARYRRLPDLFASECIGDCRTLQLLAIAGPFWIRQQGDCGLGQRHKSRNAAMLLQSYLQSITCISKGERASARLLEEIYVNERRGECGQAGTGRSGLPRHALDLINSRGEASEVAAPPVGRQRFADGGRARGDHAANGVRPGPRRQQAAEGSTLARDTTSRPSPRPHPIPTRWRLVPRDRRGCRGGVGTAHRVRPATWVRTTPPGGGRDRWKRTIPFRNAQQHLDSEIQIPLTYRCRICTTTW